jgi:hypothetical protein
LAITRQRLADPQPEATLEGMMDVFRQLGYIQLDPIRAVERTQYLVLWSRLGNYDITHLDTLLWEQRKLFEYWAHAASIVLTENYPIHHLQMRNFARSKRKWDRRIREWLEANESFRQRILSRLREDGPLFHNQVEDLVAYSWTSGGWTNDRSASMAFSFLWEQGDIVVAERQGLNRKWALMERHLPQWANHDPWPDEEVVRRAAQISLRALGVGTARHIASHFIKGHYYNLDTILANLVAEGEILPVTITGNGATWPGEWYIHAEDVSLLEQLAAGKWQPRTTLLSPFDNLIIDRDRTELMWDFYYRIEIYVPQAKRQYGYYVLPILHGDQLIGRIDPKMERKTGTLRINAVYAEPDAPHDEATAQAIATAITSLAEFLEAKQINVSQKIPPQWAQALSW